MAEKTQINILDMIFPLFFFAFHCSNLIKNNSETVALIVASSINFWFSYVLESREDVKHLVSDLVQSFGIYSGYKTLEFILQKYPLLFPHEPWDVGL